MTISPVLGADGAMIGYVYAGADRSRERELETQLNWTARMAAVGQLAEGVAHDFNNILRRSAAMRSRRVSRPAGARTRHPTSRRSSWRQTEPPS